MGLDSSFITGFAWPVPRAFASAVSACRFEQGDVLYSDPRAYGRWSDAVHRLVGQVQVLDPPRSTRPVVGEGRRFAANWDSPVELELTCAADGRHRRYVSSQGRLFACVWRGDTAFLEPESEAPEPPALQRDLHKRLEASLPAFRRHFDAELGRRPRCLYVSVVDQANDDSRVKARAIESILAESLPVAVHDLCPIGAGLAEAKGFHPALLLRGLTIGTGDTDRVEALLKALLYSPAGGKTDRFALSRHGLLVR